MAIIEDVERSGEYRCVEVADGGLEEVVGRLCGGEESEAEEGEAQEYGGWTAMSNIVCVCYEPGLHRRYFESLWGSRQIGSNNKIHIISLKFV